MDKNLKLSLWHCSVYFLYLPKRQFTGKHHTRKTDTREKLHLLNRAVVHLCTCMQRNRWYIHTCNAHILYNEGINACIVQFLHKLLNSRHLIIVYNGVQRNIHLCTENMCIIYQASNILYRIAGSLSRTELRSANIHSIGTMVNCSNTGLIILCRSKEFYLAWSL